jgi:cell wall assembly regulator SMI1
MTMQQILQDLNDDFFLDNTPSDIERQIELGHLDENSFRTKWIGYPPVSEQEICEKEKLLGMTFPPSYKRFLLTSNGFRDISPFIYRLLSLEQVDWAKKAEDQWWLDMCAEPDYNVSDENYFDYSEEQNSAYCRPEYILESLIISEWGDAMRIYLNPVVKHGDEWEVLEYASWFPGIRRYKSFEVFLIQMHKTNVYLRNEKQLPLT